MDADRILRIAMTALRQTPKLGACTPASFIGALFQSAQLGLEPSNGLGYAWLIPYGRDVTFVLGYRGLLELARRSGEISELYAYPVYAADHFNFTLGLHRNIDHQPAVDAEPTDKDLVAVYAVAKFKDGGEDFEVMTRGQVDAIRKRSKAGGSGPWVTDYAEMARKTVLKRLCKRLPLAVESQNAIAQDETIKTTLAADMTQVPDASETPDVFAGQIVDVETGEVTEAVTEDAPVAAVEAPPSDEEAEEVSGAVEPPSEPETPQSEDDFSFELELEEEPQEPPVQMITPQQKKALTVALKKALAAGKTEEELRAVLVKASGKERRDEMTIAEASAAIKALLVL
jgi:recombination protein RecT